MRNSDAKLSQHRGDMFWEKKLNVWHEIALFKYKKRSGMKYTLFNS